MKPHHREWQTAMPCPAPWLAGHRHGHRAGTRACRSNVFTLHGGGQEFWSMQPDSFLFASHAAHRRAVDLVERIVDSDAIAAGIMLRDSAAADALMTMLLFERGNRVVFRSRRGASTGTNFIRKATGTTVRK